MELDPRAPSEPRPLYEAVAERLLADFPVEAPGRAVRLPGERALAERYEVSRVTVRSALRYLVELGRATASASRGWFLEVSAHSPSRGVGVLGFTDFAKATGVRASNRVLSTTVRPASYEEAERLRIAPGADIFDMLRLRSLDDLVVALERNLLPLAVCPNLAATDFSQTSLYATLRAATPSIVPYAVDYSVGARAPSPAEAELLEITDATPVLEAHQIANYDVGKPVDSSTAIYRADRYRFRASEQSLAQPSAVVLTSDSALDGR